MAWFMTLTTHRSVVVECCQYVVGERQSLIRVLRLVQAYRLLVTANQHSTFAFVQRGYPKTQQPTTIDFLYCLSIAGRIWCRVMHRKGIILGWWLPWCVWTWGGQIWKRNINPRVGILRKLFQILESTWKISYTSFWIKSSDQKRVGGVNGYSSWWPLDSSRKERTEQSQQNGTWLAFSANTEAKQTSHYS